MESSDLPVSIQEESATLQDTDQMSSDLTGHVWSSVLDPSLTRSDATKQLFLISHTCPEYRNSPTSSQKKVR